MRRKRGRGRDSASAVAPRTEGLIASAIHSNPKLTDTQLVLLSAASQRDDGLLIPPETIKGGALAAALKALLKRGLIAEVGTQSRSRLAGPERVRK